MRELHEETGLDALAATFLFAHSGGYNDHEVFLVQVRGTPTIMDPDEAPVLGVCGPDLIVTTVLTHASFARRDLRLGKSTREIIRHYYTLVLTRVGTIVPTIVSAPMGQAGTGGIALLHEREQSIVAQIGTARLELVHGDIVQQDVDAVVNAANTHLANGGGVCGALHRAAGVQRLEHACQAIGGCPRGEARITPGFNLQARHIIHAVGPIFRRDPSGEADQLLRSAYLSSLELLSSHGLRSIAFPSLSTGIFGFPIERAASIARSTVIDYMVQHVDVALVRFVLRHETYLIFEQELRRLA